jgi:hypothetical protein
MLYALMDGRARTSTELALVAGVSPSTASVHLARLRDERLVAVKVQGKHRYYALEGPAVARLLEALNGLAGGGRGRFVPNTPVHLRAARTCYDHIAGTLGVALYTRLEALGWLIAGGRESGSRDLTALGEQGFSSLGVNVDELRASRRRFAFACLDWSERRSHLGGALGGALFGAALARKWVARARDSRALVVTASGKREFSRRFGVTAG